MIRQWGEKSGRGRVGVSAHHLRWNRALLLFPINWEAEKREFATFMARILGVPGKGPCSAPPLSSPAHWVFNLKQSHSFYCYIEGLECEVSSEGRDDVSSLTTDRSMTDVTFSPEGWSWWWKNREKDLGFEGGLGGKQSQRFGILWHTFS